MTEIANQCIRLKPELQKFKWLKYNHKFKHIQTSELPNNLSKTETTKIIGISAIEDHGRRKFLLILLDLMLF
ncbi:hypothetical protein WN51_05645 [Melipona quadrifasciata]|uniref:Uncharacterized protein n=1 Tax=Melipona quadrifasciata TaxID=166423 RepID=A0A0M8ZV73_9HYME|nr:hypothetical protein WN51_05645 [Melipona quadrifasciata]